MAMAQDGPNWIPPRGDGGFEVSGEQAADWITEWVEQTVRVILATTTAPGMGRNKLIVRGMDEIEALAGPEGGGAAWVRATIAWSAERLESMTTG